MRRTLELAPSAAISSRVWCVATDPSFLFSSVTCTLDVGESPWTSVTAVSVHTGHTAAAGSRLWTVRSHRLRTNAESSTTAHVSFGARDDGEGFGLEVVMDVNLPGIDKAVAQDIAAKAHVVCPYSHATKGNIKVTTNVL